MRHLKPFQFLLMPFILLGISGVLFSQTNVSLDTAAKMAYNFKNIKVRQSGQYVVLEDTATGKNPINITPLASINRCEELNKDHNYAIVFCLNRYFVINKYGEMSAPFEEYAEVFDPVRMLIFTRKFKKSKSFGLYEFNGKELGRMSKYALAYPEHGMENKEVYFIFQNSKKKKGLMNTKGELLLECKYADIGSITGGKCMVWPTTKTQQEVDLTKIVPLKWEK